MCPGEAAAERHRAPGQSIVEFALTAPLVFLLIFMIIDGARLIQAQVTVNNAAREAVRFAITGQQERDPSGRGWIAREITIRQLAADSLVGLALSDTPDQREYGFHQADLNPPDGGRPSQIVEVTVYYNVVMLTPLVNAIVPRVLVSGSERSINEQWGAVQNFDHANLPPTPPPLPTWTPMPPEPPAGTPVPDPPAQTATSLPTNTPASTSTAAPSHTGTPTATPTHTPTHTPTSTATPTSTPTQTSTPTATATPCALAVSFVRAEQDMQDRRLTILVAVSDSCSGAPVQGASVSARVGTATINLGTDARYPGLYGVSCVAFGQRVTSAGVTAARDSQSATATGAISQVHDVYCP